ncbi:uncharacterized protein C2845_PM11G09310 [Panicum miliaceum]|uniref:Photosystem II 5 kDa protein, chloroplastic n=1 Tax=Panicum miliaceum TaxID=4540 RepID=A0A3L6RRA1_PANMI|nr:uncharacterized protein C2845_PM11G09310 [Panicum miliaceum]
MAAPQWRLTPTRDKAPSGPQLNNHAGSPPKPPHAARAIHVRTTAPYQQLPMASLTMMASSFAAVASAAAPSRRGSLAVARAAKVERCQQQEPARLAAAAEGAPAEGRRAVMLAAAAAAVAAIGGAGAAMADPKKGTPEAKKKYAPICVTMPTAKVCHN